MTRLEEVLQGIVHIIVVQQARWQEKPPSRRDRPFPALQEMYNQAKREVRGTLGAWIHPWIPFPPLYLVREMAEDIKYRGSRHEVWLYPHEARCLERLDTSVDIVTSLLSALRADGGQSRSWEQAWGRWQACAAALQERYAGIEERGLYIEALWPRAESDLLEAEQGWRRERTLAPLEQLADDLRSVGASLWQRIHFLLIHELLHSVTASIVMRHGERIQSLSGMSTRDYDVRVGLDKPLRERDVAINECVTDWITQRIFLQVTGISDSSGYPAWIIEKLALVLNRNWEYILPTLEFLPARARVGAEEFLYTIYFTAPSAASMLRDALELVTGDRDAWEKVGHACERFDLTYPRQNAEQQRLYEESWRDLSDLFSPFLSEQERIIPAPFGVGIADEYL